jgi:hypothetical protein
MPDTGAPWNIPYVESADLVSDWPAGRERCRRRTVRSGDDTTPGLTGIAETTTTVRTPTNRWR